MNHLRGAAVAGMVAAALAALVGGCGGSSAHHTASHAVAQSTAATSSAAAPQASGTVTALPPSLRRRVQTICARAQSGEDANAIATLANRGASALTPQLLGALGHASRALAREDAQIAAALSAPGPAQIQLVRAIITEAATVAAVSATKDLAAAAPAVQAALRARGQAAVTAGLPACAGSAPGAIKPG